MAHSAMNAAPDTGLSGSTHHPSVRGGYDLRFNPTDPRHGLPSTYVNHRCRCERCKTAATAYQRDLRTERVAAGLATNDHRHGTVNGYVNWGCRCAACTEAKVEYMRGWRASSADRVGGDAR